MLECFKLKSSIAIAMLDRNTEMNITKRVLNELISTLQPVNIRADKLGNRGTILLSVEGVVSFILSKLNEQNFPFSVQS